MTPAAAGRDDPRPLDEQVKDRILDEARGNPLALLELPAGLTPAELAGGFGCPDTTPLASRIEEASSNELEPLPAATRLLLLTAAAEPLGDAASSGARRSGSASAPTPGASRGRRA